MSNEILEMKFARITKEKRALTETEEVLMETILALEKDLYEAQLNVMSEVQAASCYR